MSVVPGEIAGIGPTTLKLRVAPGFDPMKAGIGPEEYFVLSRIDGSQTLREILLATGLPLDRAIQVVTRLRAIGALLLPGETQAPAAARAPTPQPVATSRAPTPQPSAPAIRPSAPAIPRTLTPMQRSPSGTGAHGEPVVSDERVLDLSLPDLTKEERAILAETTALDDTERRRILAISRLVRAGDPWALLGVPEGADKKLLKKAYFKLSKDFHPDRYYGRALGTYGPRLEMAFEAISRAYAQLANGGPRASQQLKAVAAPKQEQAPQSPQEYALELFERACQLEVTGDALEAMKLFSACVRVDPQTRYLRRAATCALAARQPKTALEYAKKAQSQAPDDPSSARLLATAFRAVGKLADAEEVLVMAMAMKSENDVLGNELRNDLAEVRRLLAQG